MKLLKNSFCFSTAFFMGLPLWIYSQVPIDVSKKYTSILIFPSDIISDPIIGNDMEFLLIPNRSNADIARKTLKIEYNKGAKPNLKTNLVVFTKDKRVYDFRLIYKEDPQKLTHYLTVNQASKSLKKIKSKKEIEKTTSNNQLIYNQLKEIETFCHRTVNTKKSLFRVFDKSYNVKLSLKKVAFHKNKLYCYFTFKNNGFQPFVVEFIKYHKGTNTAGTHQSPLITPFFKYKEPKQINGMEQVDFVTVFDNMTINENKIITVEIKELNGERNIFLSISDQIINNPLKFDFK